MVERFVKVYRNKWIDRGPTMEIVVGGRKRRGRFGVPHRKAMFKGERDKWGNEISGIEFDLPIIFCAGNPNGAAFLLVNHG